MQFRKKQTLLIMVFFLLTSTHLFAQVSQKIDINLEKVTIKNFFNAIENKTDYTFMYKNLDLTTPVSINAEKTELLVILDRLLSPLNITYEISGKRIILQKKNQERISEDKRVITGTVTDERGEPIIGANVVEKGTTNGIITNIDGEFSLSVKENATLLISYIGYSNQEVRIQEQSSYQIVLKEDLQNLDEVVVVGYGTQKKVNLTGSVATMNVDEIQQFPASNLSNALSGRLSGVRFTQSTGRPGQGASVSIRADGTWNNTEPLYVIDGVVRDKFAFDGLDPSEVENISVLKDGASASIYGSRAANGVILVTTRKGKSGKPTISYSGSVGFSDAAVTPKVLDAYDQAILINDQFVVENVPSTDMRFFADDELAYLLENRNKFSLLDMAWKTTVLTRHTVNVSGGNDAVRYFVGGSYFYEDGSLNNLSFSKYNLRSNLEANITKDLVATLNISMDTRDDHKPYWQHDGTSESLNNLYRGLLERGSTAPPYIDGKPNGTFSKWHAVETVNGATGYNKRKYSSYDVTMSLEYSVPFVEGLSLKLMYNKFDRHTFYKQFNRPYPLYVFKTTGSHNHLCTNEVESVIYRNDGDFLYEKYDKNGNYQLNGIVTYKRKFGKHDIDALFIYEQAEGTVDWFDGKRNYFISSAVDQLFAGSSDSKNSTVDGKAEESGRISYVGRVHYGYADKYLFEAAIRHDGSVRFAPNKRWGTFPSASAAWRISEENFWKNNITFIDYLKIRGSVGLLGNDAVGGWQWQQNYNIVTGAQFGTQTNGISADVLPNPDITWEKSVSYNVGLDALLLNNKLSLNVEGFFRHTYDILGNRLASLPTTFGANMPSENYAVIDSKGFEIELGYQDRIGKEFSYYIKGNLGYATNEVKKKDEAENLRAYKSEVGYNTNRLMGYVATDIIRTQADLDALPEGYTIFGAKPELGMLNYRDIRGANSDEPDGKIDDNDKEWIINHTVPPINYGFSIGGAWKGFSLDLFFQGVAGAKRMIDVRTTDWANETAPYAFWKDHWTPENTNARFPRATRHYAGSESTFWLRNSSFLRLKNVNLSYTVPQSITSKLRVAQLNVFVTGTNLFLLQNRIKYYDPENAALTDYPNMRNVSFGVNLSF